MHLDNLLLEQSDGIATITINRPSALNALTAATLHDLERAVTEVLTSPGIRICIVTGAGPKAFVAGADIAAMQDMTPDQARALSATAHRIFAAMEHAPKPFIAAVNGYALGGGCELAMACDIRIASDNARFGQPEINLGILPGFGGTQRLPRLIGRGRSLEMILTGEMIDAREAHRIGLVNRVVAPEALLPEARKLAGTIAAKGLAAIRLCKEAVGRGLEMSLPDGCGFETDRFAASFATGDSREGMRAFLEKRPALFRDC